MSETVPGKESPKPPAFSKAEQRSTEPAGTNLLVLEYLARAVGVAFDETRAKRALRQAEIDIPPTATRASRQRLSQAAQALGLQLLSRQLSVQEALAVVEPEMPLALFSVGSDGTARLAFASRQHFGNTAYDLHPCCCNLERPLLMDVAVSFSMCGSERTLDVIVCRPGNREETVDAAIA